MLKKKNHWLIRGTDQSKISANTIIFESGSDIGNWSCQINAIVLLSVCSELAETFKNIFLLKYECLSSITVRETNLRVITQTLSTHHGTDYLHLSHKYV